MIKNTPYKEANSRTIYSDIIDMPHHQSTKHPHMSLYDRAAQFMPFAALTGYDDMINEESRITEAAISLDDSITEILNKKLNILDQATKTGLTPMVEINYFVPDSTKSGGKYITVKEKIKRIDSVNHKIVLTQTRDISQINNTIDIESVTDIKGDLVDYIDDSTIL